MSKLTPVSDKDKDIAIVGISVFCPAGDSAEEFWHGISKGVDFITDTPEEVIESEYFDGIGKDPDRFYCKRGGFANTFKVDPLRYGLLPIMADGVDPDQLMSLSGTELALRDAGVFDKRISLENASIIIGKGNFSGLIAMRCIEIVRTANELTSMLKIALPSLTDADLDQIKKAYQAKQGRWQADMAIGTMPNLVASLVANRFDMHGPAYCVDAACASGIVAINQSIELLRSGQCDISIAGGMHIAQSAMFNSTFNMMGAISRRQEISPFSKDADGLIIGQGCGFVVLKTLKKAVEDEDRIYAVIKDTAVCSDGGGSHVTVTSIQGEKRVMDMAWKRAGMDPDVIGFVEAHGTGTPVGDKTEIAALKEFFGDNTKKRAYVASVKSNIGHTMPAAGMFGIIKTALSLYHRKIPPTLHCEDPLPAMYESRFRAPLEAIDWDGDEIPLVGGVNAFGFGGINSHAILAAYEPISGIKSDAPRLKPYMGETLMVSAEDKDTLIRKLRTGDYTNTGGDYRIVIFDPDEDRIDRAISIAERDKPWRGRLDIWFSNKPLLKDGGKIVYLFPGFNLDQISETDSLSDSFGLPRIDDVIDDIRKKTERAKDTDEQHFHDQRINFIQFAGLTGLEKLGIEADMYAGHSVGEWAAASYAGISQNDIGEMRELVENYDFSDDCPLIAVNGVDIETAEAWCEEISGLYLSNDNCPGQILLCGKPQAAETLILRLEENKIFYNVMPFSVAMHTPLMSDKLQPSVDYVKTLNICEGKVPVWSATTLELVPTNKKDYIELVEKQLTNPVYFRSLIEKLYAQEKARIFIQIGLGTLVGFVENILKEKEFSAITTGIPTRDGADQLRRVLAALFVEGKEVDADFLGVKPMYQVEHNLMILPRGIHYTKEFPELADIVRQHYGAMASGENPGLVNPESIGNPFHRAAANNLNEVIKGQAELVRLFDQAPPSPQVAPIIVPPEPTKASFTETLTLKLEEHSYLLDHAIVRQPEGWPFNEDLNAVVPFTMTIELLAEIASKHEPNRKLVKIQNISALQWIAVKDTFEGTVKGIRKGADRLDLELVNHAKAEFHFADDWAAPPAEYASDIDIGEEILPPIPAEELYDRYAFHGSQYHSATKTLKICSGGMLNLAEAKTGKGSLLDIMGQQLGLFLHLTQKTNVISFPTRLSELHFYNDYVDQEGVFEHSLIVTRLSDTIIAGDMVLKRDGKIWCVAKNFVCQRFVSDPRIWNVSLKPQYNKLAKELAPGVYHYSGACTRANIQAFMSARYIDREDRSRYMELADGRRQREFLFSRIALKDAVRDYISKDRDEMPYPIQIFLHHDENGKPFVCGYGELAERVDSLHVSLAHKGDEAIAMVADKPIGIDLERIDAKAESFLVSAFTEDERMLLRKDRKTEDVIRFWVAKEACGKKAGTGLQGDPKRYEIRKVDGDIIHIGNEKVQIVKIGNDHIAGWTI